MTDNEIRDLINEFKGRDRVAKQFENSDRIVSRIGGRFWGQITNANGLWDQLWGKLGHQLQIVLFSPTGISFQLRGGLQND